MEKDEQYYKKLFDEYSIRIKEANRTISKKIPSSQKVKEAIKHHQEQLKEIGHTEEDDISEILRGVLKQAIAKEELPFLRKECKRYRERLKMFIYFPWLIDKESND